MVFQNILFEIRKLNRLIDNKSINKKISWKIELIFQFEYFNEEFIHRFDCICENYSLPRKYL